MDLICIVELEVDILDDEGPDVVAEAVGVEVSLHVSMSVCRCLSCSMRPTDLEGEARFDLVAEDVCNGLVEVEEDLHGKLRLYPALGDKLIQGVGEGAAETCAVSQSASGKWLPGA